MKLVIMQFLQLSFDLRLKMISNAQTNDFVSQLDLAWKITCFNYQQVSHFLFQLLMFFKDAVVIFQEVGRMSEEKVPPNVLLVIGISAANIFGGRT
uniref:Delta-guaiene synthase n=1 Tax=Aquilaria malaccensis TaxID=223753 RepID=A0A4Y6GNH2_9ROSI|nr:delta-guaiene synthase [Aquilaria malaccensis]